MESTEEVAATAVAFSEAIVEGAEPVMEERLGWRQKSLEPRPDRPKRHKPQRKPEGGEQKAHGDRPRGEKRERYKGKDGNKPDQKPHRDPKPDPKPYINPYSPFAILREKLGQN